MHVYCVIKDNCIEIFRGEEQIGQVVNLYRDDPSILLFLPPPGDSSANFVQLSFNDIEIIQDNWVQYWIQYKEMLLTKKSKSVE